MKKSIVVLLHMGFWICYLFIIIAALAVLLRNETDNTRFGYYLKIFFGFAIAPSTIAFYAFYFLLFPRYLKTKAILATISYGIAIAFGSAVVGFAIMYNMIEDSNNEQGGIESYIGTAISVTSFMALIAFVSGFVAFVIRGFITWFEEIKLKEALQQKNHEMELALVKSQLDPHFLFNTINNIDVLILKDATEASNYLNKLSDILRFILYETKTDKIPLSKEVEYIEKYIELHKIRTSNSNYVKFLVTGVLGGKTIAPMVFIPFIENAFKHTNNKKLDHAIVIHIMINDKAITFTCDNRYNSNAKKQAGSGLGNDLIQKRLDLLYPGKHTLNILNQEELYCVKLVITDG